MFGKAKEQFELVKKAKEIQKKLKETTVEGESGAVKIVMNGEQKIQSVTVDKDSLGNIESDIKNAVTNVIEKAQKIAADVMKESGLDLPGM